MVSFEFQHWSDAETDILAVIGLLQLLQDVNPNHPNIDCLYLAERLLSDSLQMLDAGRIR